MLLEWNPQNTVRLIRNPYFNHHSKNTYDKEPYTLIDFSIVDDATAVAMVEAHTLDWAGSPMGTLPVDCVTMLACQKNLLISPAAATSFLRINVTHPLLSDQRLREALSLVINRCAIVHHLLQGGQLPAFSLVPPCLLTASMPQGHINKKHAKELLKTYCEERGCTPESLSITLAFNAEDRSTKVSMAIQQDIKKALGINVLLLPCDAKQFFAKVSKLDYDMALGSWVADYFDPHSFYSVFERSSNGTNNTGWESASYQSLIKNSLESPDPALRQQYFSQLEDILAREVPVIPIYHYSFNYVKEASVDGITISPLGYLDVMQP
jgi:oligopeptide transport system substrate-binding protein